VTPKERDKSRYPDHIDPEKLPDHVGYDPRGKGRFFYRRRIGNNRGKEFKLGNGELKLAEIWQAVERIESGSVSTFKSLSLEFQKSPQWKKLKRSTQEDYEKCHKSISNRENRAGTKIGEIRLMAWTPGAVRRYRDMRAEQSESRANKELAYMKRVFQWGVEYEHIASNPAKDISGRGLAKRRTHYIQDPDFKGAINLAPLNIAMMIHLAYLTGRRRDDIVAIHKNHIWKEGLYFPESKTDKESLVAWTDELTALVNLAKEESGESVWLFPAKEKGAHYRLPAMDTAWQRICKAMTEKDLVRFQFKDIRAKHASDLEDLGGDATANLLHSDRSVTKRHYLRKPKKIVSLR